MDIHVRDEIEADLPAIVDIWNQSIPACRSTADTQPITVAGRVVGFRKFDPARWRNKERPLPERGASPLSFRLLAPDVGDRCRAIASRAGGEDRLKLAAGWVEQWAGMAKR